MSRWQFVIRSLAHHWRVHLAVLFGVAVATAVLTGALLVGDSIRGSLRYIALDRLGRIDHIILSDRFFRAELAAEMAAHPGFTCEADREAIPAILLRSTIQLTEPPSLENSGAVTLLGVDERFWNLGDRCGGGQPIRPKRLPKGREIVLNSHLADQIGARIGDELLVRLPRVATVPADSPMGKKADTVQTISQLVVIDIIPTEGLGRFSLSPSQQLPAVAYLDKRELQRSLKQSDKVNAIVVARDWAQGPTVDLQPKELALQLRPSIEDFGLRIKHVRRDFTDPASGDTKTIFDYYSLSSDRMLLPPEVEAAAEQAFAEFSPQPVYTYLANTIAKEGAPESPEDTATADQPQGRPIPYSTITAINSTAELGPLFDDDGMTPMDALADDEIVLHAWAAKQLHAVPADELHGVPGDRIVVTFFEPESTHGRILERTVRFRLKARVPLTEPNQPYSDGEPAVYTSRPTRVNDPDLTPEVPGVTDKESLDDWDPPFPFDQRRIKPPDDEYWENYRTTPKAFIALERGRELWGSRFGQTTSVRVPATDRLTADALAAEKSPEELLAEKLLFQLYRDRAHPGFALLPVRQNALDASSGATPFDGLFLGFSMFIIASALMLVALLFRLGIEQRAVEIGTLLAVGLRRRSITLLFGREGGIIATTGSLLGVLGGLGYAWLMLAGLKTWWVSAIVTPFVQFHATEKSLAIGYVAGAVTAVGTFGWGIANLRHVPLRQLLAGRATRPVTFARRRHQVSFVLAWLLLVIASGLLAYGTQSGGEPQALAFFGAGASLLAAGLLFVWRWFRQAVSSGGNRGFSSVIPLVQLALRNAARNPGRSTLTIGLVAAASFLIVAISAFQLQPSVAGTGGFDWIGETSQPVYQDLSSKDGRDELGIIGDDAALLAESDIFGLRVQSGDDASCLNLFQAKRPRVIGLPTAFVSHFDEPEPPRFAFAAPSAGKRNLWKLLQQERDDDVVPVILDRNTAMFALHLYSGVGEIFKMTDDITGRPIRFQVVALTADSIFQGNLLVSEANFEKLFPGQSGYGLFLIRTPQGQMQPVRRVLQDRLRDYGFRAGDARQRMEALQTVQNTYLSTFQSLGALGLLLGTLGLATVQLRSVLERRSELALMRAAGFRRGRLAALVLCENAVLLIGGLLLGIVSALITVLPHMFAGGAALPVRMLAIMLGVVPVVGLLSGLLAVWATLRAPLIPALRGD